MTELTALSVRAMSLAAVFRRRSRHGRYMMTTVTTGRRNARSPTISLRLCGDQERF